MIIIKKLNNFTDWNIDRILFSKELQSSFFIDKLANIIMPRGERIKPSDVPKVRKIVSKIRFIDGNVSFADRVVKNDMFKSCLNDLLVSNINLEKGAFAVNIWGDIYASTDYTSYIIDLEKIVPEYLQVTLRSKTFLQYVVSVKPKGMKTRARYEFIKDFSIPLPSISEQKKLLDEYHRLIEQAKLLENEATVLENGIDNYLFNVFNLTEKDTRIVGTSLLNTTRLSENERWDVDYTLNQTELSFLDECNCELRPARTFILSTQYGLSEKANRDSTGVPMIRMGNIQNCELDVEDMKYLPNTTKLDGRYLDKGDLLFNRTNSKELVGKTAIFKLDADFVFASYLIRVKLDHSQVDVEYINYLFASKIIRKQIDLVSRQVLGQVNINVDELCNLRFPVPPIVSSNSIDITQEKIVSEIKRIKEEAKNKRIAASMLWQDANIEFEDTIFSN